MHHNTAKTLLTFTTAFSAKSVVGNAISFIQKQRPLLFPLLAHSRHSKQSSSYYKVVVIRVPLQGQNATIDKVLWIGLNLLPQDGFGKAPTTALCF